MGRIGIVLILLPLGLALLGLGVLHGLHQPSDLTGIGICALGGFAFLAFGAWRWWMESSRRVALFDTGLEVLSGGKHSAIRFEEMEEVWLTVQRVQTGGLLGMAVMAAIKKMRAKKPLDERGLSLQMRVAGGGTTLKLSEQDKGIFAAYEEITRRVNPRLVQSARQRIDSGATVAFNKISLSREGLSFGKKLIRLPEIEKITIQNGQFSVKVTGKWFKSGQSISRIPNLYVLTELVNQLSGGTIAMDIPMGVNLASHLYV